jgi:hypothetical protein
MRGTLIALMLLEAQMWRRRLVLMTASMLLGCPPRAIDNDIARPNPGEPLLAQLPGPPLGSFNSFEDALLAACTKIITKPNTVTPPREHQHFDTYWRVASEYCAWIYYTPDTQYVLSRLTDQSRIDPSNKRKTCVLPSTVEDQRYPPDAITYLCALHNHTYDSILSIDDMDFIVNEGMKRGEAPYYGFFPNTQDGHRFLSIVAFFSNHLESPTGDGFYQYTPLNGHLLKHTRLGEQWECEQIGHVRWIKFESGAEVPSIEKVNGPCPEKSAP